MDDGDLVAQLTRLGLTSYEAKAYLALIRRDSFTAAQVARQAGLPRQRIYDVLGSLVQKGLAVGRPGDVVKYAAISAGAGHRAAARAAARRLAELERDAPSMVDTLKPAFEAGQEHTDPLEYIEVLRDRRAINERFAELQAQVKREILVFTKPPYATPPQENVEGLEVSQDARGAQRLRVLASSTIPPSTRGVQRFIEAGEEARFVRALPLKLVIIDETIVMFGMEDPVAGSAS